MKLTKPVEKLVTARSVKTKNHTCKHFARTEATTKTICLFSTSDKQEGKTNT
jgi:hypothetical protein